MSHVEIVRAICLERGLPIYKLERDLGFSNGYLNPKKTRDIPYAKLCSIADYLNVSVEELTGTVDRIKNPASPDADGIGEKLSNPSPAAMREGTAWPHGWAVFFVVEPFAPHSAGKFPFIKERIFTAQKVVFLCKC